MKRITRLAADAVGLWRVCGPLVAIKWMLQVLAHARSVLRAGNLQPADVAMGPGPFSINLRRYASRFRVTGPRAISGIREMYVRDVYLRGGWLGIGDGDVVLDLGANVGNFTNLALSMGPNVRVISVEPSRRLTAALSRSVDLNAGFEARTQVVRAFLGKPGAVQAGDMQNADYGDSPWISEDELIARAGITRLDFIKCDIEGGEYDLLGPSSRLLAMANALAVEVHAFAGNVEEFVAGIRSSGFEIGPVQRDPDGTATVLAKRAAARARA